MEKTVITYGTYDLFHVGHLRLLKRLKSLGDKLIVGISSDEFNEGKGKKTIIPFEQRVEIVESISCVDQVIKEDSWDQKANDIRKYNIDVFAMGNDWEGKFDELKEHCQVVYLPRTKSISSTEIKVALQDVLKIEKEEIQKHFEILNQLLEDLR